MKERFYVVSDMHFNHSNVVLYEPCRTEIIASETNLIEEEVLEILRSKSKEEIKKLMKIHDEFLIKKWNKMIRNNDVVFFLGDFTLGDREYTKELIGKLKGRKRMIMGNHDRFQTKFYLDAGFEEVSRYPILFNHHIMLSHEPLPHDMIPEGCINFFGHVHSKTDFNWSRGKCVSIEQTDFRPYEITKYVGNYKHNDSNRHLESGVCPGQLKFDI